MSDEPDIPTPEPSIAELRSDIDRAIRAFVAAANPGHDPYVLGWALATEWTDPQLERDEQACRDTLTADSQMVSTSYGLGMFLADTFSLRRVIVHDD